MKPLSIISASIVIALLLVLNSNIGTANANDNCPRDSLVFWTIFADIKVYTSEHGYEDVSRSIDFQTSYVQLRTNNLELEGWITDARFADCELSIDIATITDDVEVVHTINLRFNRHGNIIGAWRVSGSNAVLGNVFLRWPS